MGVPTLLDSWVADYDQPLQDTSLGGHNSAMLLAAVESEGGTAMQFTRLLDTGDVYDVAIDNNTLCVLIAYGLVDGVGTVYPEHVSDDSVCVSLTAVTTNTSTPSLFNSSALNMTQLFPETTTAALVQDAGLQVWWTVDIPNKTISFVLSGTLAPPPMQQ